MNECWFTQQSDFILGGKWGDCVQMTGAFHAIAERVGHPVNVVCSTAYAPIFDGCSFVNTVPVQAHWADGMAQMKQVAKDATVLQFWNDADSPELKAASGRISLQIHGRRFSVDTDKEPHYSASMFRRAGFNWTEAMELRPVFDMRNPTRETELLDRCWPKPKRTKPMLLVMFDGQSSPWGYLPEAFPMLNSFYRHFHVVDLGKMKANRIYDMLALFESAVGLITVDTLSLHLAAATDIPYVAFTQNGWVGSVPKGNCVLRIPYSETIRRLPEMRSVLEEWQRDSTSKTAMLVSHIG